MSNPTLIYTPFEMRPVLYARRDSTLGKVIHICSARGQPHS